MTTDELRLLIAECKKPGSKDSYLGFDAVLALAEDALRFRFLLENSDYYGARCAIHWSGLVRNVRSAIDADMEKQP